jgi:hypothetical protein
MTLHFGVTEALLALILLCLIVGLVHFWALV